MKCQLHVCILLSVIILTQESVSAESEDVDPIVSIKHGKVRGIKVRNHYEFRKIPFAEPPLGKFRFKPPVEPTPWAGVLDGDKDSDYCIQYNVFWNKTEGVEDCLYLNIFTPERPDQIKEKLPVMVYIHSGGFMFGRGTIFRGDYLMQTKNVIVVVFQYRLGSFGFLNTEDNESIGNFGMKDQVAALQWVKENIEAFKGNKNQVMIFGTSAGAASVHYHILSPQSKGLFHAAYSGSGTALCPWAFQPKPKENAQKLGKYLNCPTDESKALVECLRSKDAHDIGMAHSKFLEWYVDPIAAFGPSLEVGNPDPSTRFIDATPADIISKGEVNQVPWMLGFNTDEGHEHSLTIFKRGNLLEELNSNWEKLFPITFEYVHESEAEKKDMSKKIREFYFENKDICNENLKNLSNAYSDKTYVLCTLRSAYRHAKIGKTKTHPIYLFLFAYKGDNSIVTLRGYPNEGFGTNHMDDIQYLVNSILFPFLDESSKDKPFQKSYAKMITEFASTGTIPPFSKDRPQDVWQPLDPGGNINGIKWYHVTSQPRMEPISEDWSKRMKFWEQFDIQEYAVSRGNQPKDEF